MTSKYTLSTARTSGLARSSFFNSNFELFVPNSLIFYIIKPFKEIIFLKKKKKTRVYALLWRNTIVLIQVVQLQ